MGGTPDELPDDYALVSPLTVAPSIKAPVLLVAGSLDLHAPVDNCFALRDALERAGNRRVEVEILELVGHFFEKMYSGRAYQAIADQAVGWFGKTLTA
jgi:dipeptidyl aminopeptidase/acylaminoacyl peptidase